MSRHIVVTLVCWSLATGACRLMQAQVVDSTRQDTTAVPAAIPLAQLSSRATAYADTLRLRYADLQADRTIAALHATITRRADALQVERTRLDSTDIGLLGFRRLDDMLLRWRGDEDQFLLWQSDMATNASTLDSLGGVVASVRELWVEAGDTALAAGMPQNILDRVATVIGLIDNIGASVTAQRRQVLEAQGHVSDGLVAARGALVRIDAARALARRRTLVRTAPPIWSLRSGQGDETLAKTPFVITDLRDFALAHEVAVWVQFMFFGGLLALNLALQRRMNARRVDEVPIGVRRALQRPVAGTLLLTLISTPLLYEALPGGIGELVLFIVALTVLRLAPLYVVGPRLVPLMVLLSLIAIHEIVALFVSDPVALRLELMGIAVGMGWALDRLRRQVTERPFFIDRLLYTLVQVGVVLFAVAFAANVLGFTNLVIVLIDGAVGTALITVALIMAVDALEGIVAAISQQRLFGTIPGFRLHQAVVTSRTLQLVRLGAVLLWILLVATAFGVSDLLGQGVLAVWRANLPIGAWTLSVGSILIFVLSVSVSIAVGSTVRAILRDDVLRRMRLARGMPNTIATLTFYAIVTLGFLFGVGAAGVDLGAFALVFGALGVGIGFGLQNIVNDFISGLVLMFERPIQVGDIVQLDELIGTVSDVGIRASTVKTFEGAEVIVPNGQLVSARVVNWTLSDRTRRVDIPVGVAYGTSPSDMIDLLLKTAEDHDDVRSNPEPLAFFKGFGESSLDFELRFWTNEFLNWRQVASDVTVRVNDAIVAAGIEIPFPQRDLHVRSVDEDVVATMLRSGSSRSTKSRKR